MTDRIFSDLYILLYYTFMMITIIQFKTLRKRKNITVFKKLQSKNECTRLIKACGSRASKLFKRVHLSAHVRLIKTKHFMSIMSAVISDKDLPTNEAKTVAVSCLGKGNLLCTKH